MSQHIISADEILQATYEGAVPLLDAHRRAWVLGIGRCVDLESNPDSPGLDVENLIVEAFETGDYPAGPFSFTPSAIGVERNSLYQVARAEFPLPCDRSLRCRVAVAEPSVLIEGISRGGCVFENETHSSHVLLTDVESVLMDTLTLLETAAEQVGYSGPRRLMIALACDIPGEALELRVYDEGDGNVVRPPAGYRDFAPVFVEYPGPLSPEETEQVLWQAALEIALRFGVFNPQMVGRPHRSDSCSCWALISA